MSLGQERIHALLRRIPRPSLWLIVDGAVLLFNILLIVPALVSAGRPLLLLNLLAIVFVALITGATGGLRSRNSEIDEWERIANEALDSTQQWMNLYYQEISKRGQ